jgi:hypothetical protein
LPIYRRIRNNHAPVFEFDAHCCAPRRRKAANNWPQAETDDPRAAAFFFEKEARGEVFEAGPVSDPRQTG